jgi:hypothetical protein
MNLRQSLLSYYGGPLQPSLQPEPIIRLLWRALCITEALYWTRMDTATIAAKDE